MGPTSAMWRRGGALVLALALLGAAHVHAVAPSEDGASSELQDLHDEAASKDHEVQQIGEDAGEQGVDVPVAMASNEVQAYRLANGYPDNSWLWNATGDAAAVMEAVTRDYNNNECIYLSDAERVDYCQRRLEEQCDGAMRDWFCDINTGAQCNPDYPYQCVTHIVGGPNSVECKNYVGKIPHPCKFGHNDIHAAAGCCKWDANTGTTFNTVTGESVSGSCSYVADQSACVTQD